MLSEQLSLPPRTFTFPELPRFYPPFRRCGGGFMENQPTGAIRTARSGRRAVTPAVCVADAEQSMRTFLRATLEELGFVAFECVRAAELDAVLDSQRPDLVVIGSSAGGIDACQMVELLAAKEFGGKVVVFGPRVSPMVTAIQALGEKLGLAMLPLLPTPFSSGNVRDCVATLAPVEAAPFAARDTREALRADRARTMVPAEDRPAHARAVPCRSAPACSASGSRNHPVGALHIGRSAVGVCDRPRRQ